MTDRLDLPPDALDWIGREQAMPPLSARAALWTWLTDRVPILRRYRGSSQAAYMPAVDPDCMAELLAAMTDPEIRGAMLAILRPGIEAIAREMLQRGGR